MLPWVFALLLLAITCFSSARGQSSDYPLCDSGYEDLVGNGGCSDINNTEDCGWDGGDCCECDCENGTWECGALGYDCRDPDSTCYGGPTTDDFYDSSDDFSDFTDDFYDDDYPLCDGSPSLIGSGACLGSNNNEDCGWDGGDCCECDCVSASSDCGSLGYDCQDPGSACYGDLTADDDIYGNTDDYFNDDSITIDYPSCDGDVSLIASGACTVDNNNAECGWDGGDCCECDCIPDFMDCGSQGYDCQDPSSACYEGLGYTTYDDFSNYDDDGYPLCDGDSSIVGNGICTTSNNNEECGWDGGDCCECDCFFALECGTVGYDCQDPTSTCYEGAGGTTYTSDYGNYDDDAPLAGDENGDGLVNSADTGIVGDTNGDGVVDDADTGLVGDTNGDGVVNDADEVVAGVGDDGSGDGDDFPIGVVIGCVAGGVLLLGAIVACVLIKTGRLKTCSCCCGSNPAMAAGTQNVPGPDSGPSASPPPAYTSPVKGSSAVDKRFDATGAPSASTHPPPPPPPPPVDPSSPPPAYDEHPSAPAPTAAPHHDTTEGPPVASVPPPPPPEFSDYHITLPPSRQ